MALTQTRSDLIEYARRAVGAGALDDTARLRYEQGVENALKMLSREREWSWQRDVIDLVTTACYPATPDVALTVTIPTTASVTFSGTTLPAGVVGAFLEFASERHWYEITVRGGDTSATIRNVYSGNIAGGTASQSFMIVFPLLDLPANFRNKGILIDVEDNEYLEDLPYDPMWLLHSERTGAGEPEKFSIIPKRNDPNQWQLMLYPAPLTARAYQLAYIRNPGWFTTAVPATSAWAAVAPTGTAGDAYYVDWPDDLLFLLRLAVVACVADEIAPDQSARHHGRYRQECDKAAAQDRKRGKPMYLGRPAMALSGTLYRWGE